MDSIAGFIDSSKNLSRNPLGIIALFIGLIYAFATLLLGATAGKLSSFERLPLIWFVVIFPVLVLIAFYRLVTCHHGKLYSPTDFKNDRSFLKTLSDEQKNKKLEDEVETIAEVAVAESKPEEKQKSFKPNDALMASAAKYDLLRSTVIKAEDLTLRRIERELGQQLERQISFGGNPVLAFDAAAVKEGIVTVVEVKVLRSPMIVSSFVRETYYRALLAAERVKRAGRDKGLKLILAFVFIEETGSIDMVKRTADRVLSDAGINVERKYFRLADLQKEFGI